MPARKPVDPELLAQMRVMKVLAAFPVPVARRILRDLAERYQAMDAQQAGKLLEPMLFGHDAKGE